MACADLCDDVLEGCEGSFGRVDVGLAQLGSEGDVAAEAVEGQVAVALVVAQREHGVELELAVVAGEVAAREIELTPADLKG